MTLQLERTFDDVAADRVAISANGSKWAARVMNTIVGSDGASVAAPPGSNGRLYLDDDGIGLWLGGWRGRLEGDGAWVADAPELASTNPWRTEEAVRSAEVRALLLTDRSSRSHTVVSDFGVFEVDTPLGLACSDELVAVGGERLRVWASDGTAIDAGDTGQVRVLHAVAMRIVGGSTSGELVWWAPEGHERMPGHDDRVDAVAAPADGMRWVTGSRDGSVALWSGPGELVAMTQVPGAVADIAVSGDGSVILVAAKRPWALHRFSVD